MESRRRPIDVTVHSGVTVTTVSIVTPWGDAVGEAKCHPKDTFNSLLGEKLALSRAMEFMAMKLMIQCDDVIYPQQYVESPF